jgi:predicted RNase H-like HicB family nuclease
MTTKLNVRVWEEGGYWLTEAEEEPRVHSFGRTPFKAIEATQDAAALWFDVPIDAVEITPHVQLRADIAQLVASALQAREEADRAAARASELTIEAVRACRAVMSVRNTAEVIGLSPQRVQQLGTAVDDSPLRFGASEHGVTITVAHQAPSANKAAAARKAPAVRKTTTATKTNAGKLLVANPGVKKTTTTARKTLKATPRARKS